MPSHRYPRTSGRGNKNLEVLNLRAIAGQYDLQERHTAMTKLPVFLENRNKVGYDVKLDPALNGSDATLQVNHSYEADAEVAKWCAEILQMSPTAIALAKRSFNADTEMIRGISSFAMQALKLYYDTEESKEGGNAFREKRKPDFRKYANK